MSYATATPRDVLAMGPDPRRISAAAIQRALGIGERQAAELKLLACRAPEFLLRTAPPLIATGAEQGRAVAHG